MRYFFDTEFLEDGKTIDLLSIGIVAEDGRELYIENQDADVSKANEWVQANVLPHLWHRQSDKSYANRWSRDGGIGGYLPRHLIEGEIRRFCAVEYGPPEFWTYYGAYDWVALCQLFGDMSHLPKGWPMYAYDLRQQLDHMGCRDVRQPDDAPHHALSDAQWIAEMWRGLVKAEMGE